MGLVCGGVEEESKCGMHAFRVTRRIKAMNRRLQKELGYDVAEKMSHKWMLTDFMVDVWGSEKEDIEKLV